MNEKKAIEQLQSMANDPEDNARIICNSTSIKLNTIPSDGGGIPHLVILNSSHEFTGDKVMFQVGDG